MLNTKVFEYSAKEVKLAISGTGSAKKEQLAFMVQHIIGKKLDFKNDDESDAVCVALTNLFTK
jgi:crossover junction endodeoxyribonuclease RuvC